MRIGARMLIEAGRDLAAQRLRSVITIAVLTGLAWATMAVHRENTRALASLEAELSSPTATLLRVSSTNAEARFTTEEAAAMASLDQVIGVLALGPPMPARSPFAPNNDLIVRHAHGDIDGQAWAVACDSAQITPALARSVGLAEGIGVITVDETPLPIDGARELPPSASFLSETILVRTCDPALAATELAIFAASPQSVHPISTALANNYPPGIRTTLQIRSQASQISQAHRALDSTAAAHQRMSVLASGGVGAMVALVFGLTVVQRRRDYGRRRALGAWPAYIAALVITQAFIAMTAAMALAVIAELLVTISIGTPHPSPRMVVGTTIMVLCAAGLGSLIPAVIAASRDPLRELRVP